MGVILYCDGCGEFTDIDNMIDYKLPTNWTTRLIGEGFIDSKIIYCCGKQECFEKLDKEFPIDEPITLHDNINNFLEDTIKKMSDKFGVDVKVIKVPIKDILAKEDNPKP